MEGDPALRRLPLAHQLRPREPGLSSRARPPGPSAPEGGARRTALRPPAPRRLRRPRLRPPQVQKQETWGFPAFGMGVGLWLTISSLPRRRLVLNHTLGMYHFSIQGRTVCQGPMHLVYVRLALSSDGEAWGGRQSEGHHASEGETSWGGEGRAGGAPPPEPCPGASRPLLLRVQG